MRISDWSSDVCSSDLARRAELHNNLGNVLKQQNRYDEALDCFDRATVLRPNYAEAHANRGFALAGRGTTEEAASALDAAIALQIGSASCRERVCQYV